MPKRLEDQYLCVCCAHYMRDLEECKQCRKCNHWLSPEDDTENENEEDFCFHITARNKNEWNEGIEDRTLAD